MAWALLDPASRRSATRGLERGREMMRLFDPTFKYVPSSCTDVAATWRRFGFRPTTESERRARRRREAPVEAPGSVDLGGPLASSLRSAGERALKLAISD